MKRHISLKFVAAALGGAAAFSSQALGVTQPGLDAANHAQWDENTYFGSFGGPPPAGSVEFVSGFSTFAQFDGRVLSNAAITANTVDSTVLTTISTGLVATEDANLYQIQITNPATFSASVPSTSIVLALFNSAGKGLAASIGGPGDAITGANAGVTTPGIYYIGLADSGGYPQNTADQNIFGLTGTAGVFTPVTSDAVLSADPYNSWTTPGGSSGPLLANTSFLAASSTISLSGSNFAVVPEPATIGLLGTLGVAALARRRRVTV